MDGGQDFVDRYGPWAVVAGASDGVGEAYARAMAERGLNVVIVARRASVLDALAEDLRSETGVDVLPVALDLAAPDAAARLVDATEGLEVGMLMYCAGGDGSHGAFLDKSIDESVSMVQRNCVVPLQLCHHFAAPMRARGHGGLVLLSSAAALYGGRSGAPYGATKAYDLVLTESLWVELRDEGVDVLALVLGLTDTPSLRRLLVERGALPPDNAQIAIAGASTSEEVVEEAIANLRNGPTWFVGEMLRAGAAQLGAMPRKDAIEVMLQADRSTMDARRG